MPKSYVADVPGNHRHSGMRIPFLALLLKDARQAVILPRYRNATSDHQPDQRNHWLR